MPIAPVLPPTLESLRLRALDEALAIIDQSAAQKGLPPPSVFMKTAASLPNSLNALTVTAAMRLVLHEAFVLASENAKLTVCVKGGIKQVNSVTCDGGDDNVLHAYPDKDHMLSLEKLFI